MNIRSVNLDTDVADLARLFTACDPTDPVTEAELRAEFQRNLPGRVTQRLVAVDENDVLTAYFNLVHVAEAPAHHFYIWPRVDPVHRGQGIGSALWEASLAFLQAQGASCLSCEVMDTNPASLAFAERRGFSIDRHHYGSILDLTDFNETPFQPGIAVLEAQGIRFCSLADFPDTSETRCKFYELNLAVVKDIPGESWDFAAYPQFFEQRILGASWFRREGQLLAVDGETWAGFASIQLLPETQSAYNATTGVIRAYRERKISLALKVLATRYARQYGAQTICTDNDSLNAPILAVNQKMGYRPQPGTYQLVRWLKEE